MTETIINNLEDWIPLRLKESIAAYLDAEAIGSSLLDCLQDSLESDINQAYRCKQITETQANFLQSKYL